MELENRQKRFQNALKIYKDKIPFSLLFRLLSFDNEIDLQNWLLDLDSINFMINIEEKTVEYLDDLEKEIDELFMKFDEAGSGKKLGEINEFYEADLIYGILSFLRGGPYIQLKRIANRNGPLLAQVVTYVLNQREGYHRKNYCLVLLSLIHSSDLKTRDLSWSLMERSYLSHLLELSELLTPDQNSRRLRLMLTAKFALSTQWEIYRAFLISPQKFKRLFIFCKLPRYKIKDVPITNKSYTLCIQLIDNGFKSTIEANGINLVKLLLESKVPLHRLVHYITSDFEEIAVSLTSEEFMRHIQFFRRKLSTVTFNNIVKEKIQTLKNPFEFLRKKEFQDGSQTISKFGLELIRQRSNEMVEKLLSKNLINRIAILVDVSVSLEITKQASIHLFRAFGRMEKSITHIIAFNDKSWPVTVEELQNIVPHGKTSIGGAFSRLFSELEDQPEEVHPQVILLITDYEENSKPYLKDVLAETKFTIPFVTIRISGRRNLRLPNYPHTLMIINEYHGSFLVNYIKEIMYLISKLLSEPKPEKAKLQSKFILENTITNIIPERRNEKTKLPGYLKSILTE
ncbi:MAG: VWA domain-containing protein [Candidatus Heimdallarchaeota archaeon]|nr:VWA domain-containing protein [Candidatus Heimdallarchaeota archaeon]